MRSRLPIAFALVLAALAAPSGAAAASNPWLAKRFLDMAHQGGEDEFPSNTMFAFRKALAAGANTLELDVSATRDGVLVVMHDTSVDRTTNGSGWLNEMTWAQVSKLDNAYYFVPGRNAVKGLPASRYPYRGIATGRRKPPRGFRASDFRVARLVDVLRAFPHTPINIEIKGRGDAPAEYMRNAELLAKLLERFRNRRDLIVVSFNQDAVDRFHQLVPSIPVAPGVAGIAAFLLGGGSPGDGVVALQIPITYRLGGQLLQVTTPDSVWKAHKAGYAVHVWLSDDTEDVRTYETLIDECVDGIMAAKPRLLAQVLRRRHVVGPDGKGTDPCSVRARRAALHGSTVSVSLERRGSGPQPYSGTVELRAGTARGRLLARGRFALPEGARDTQASLRLGAAARRLLRGGRPRVLAVVRTRGARGEPNVTRVRLG
ncbi:MAG: glycerophosphodiester phosphodiesterase [Thermoleophilaceae bacterium]|nr:glycerophosphodiester phosphodiesterase [Thermoleophilaceae bacterium]